MVRFRVRVSDKVSDSEEIRQFAGITVFSLLDQFAPGTEVSIGP